MSIDRVLVVDDDEVIASSLANMLTHQGFEVTVANNVPTALGLITSESFDVLLSDLHMPGAGDGLTVVSAMRHSNPKAVTILLSAFPEMNEAAHAIMLQADEILVKPMGVSSLVEVIKQRLVGGVPASRMVESVAEILERSIPRTVGKWYERVQAEESLMAIPLSQEQRTGHLPKVLHDVVDRLRSFKPLGSKELVSDASREHGQLRRKQGYTGEMMIQESRMLQVSIFETLRSNLGSIDFSVLLDGVMTIADEVDSQLGQAMKSYNAEAIKDAIPV